MFSSSTSSLLFGETKRKEISNKNSEVKHSEKRRYKKKWTPPTQTAGNDCNDVKKSAVNSQQQQQVQQKREKFTIMNKSLNCTFWWCSIQGNQMIWYDMIWNEMPNYGFCIRPEKKATQINPINQRKSEVLILWF